MANRSIQNDEQKVYGLHACQALFEHRAGDIVRAYVTEERLKPLGSLLKWCAKQKKAYHVVTDEDLNKLAASVHHEGVLLIAKAKPRLDDAAMLARAGALGSPSVILYLDGVGNPHNVGSIVRVAAHFGAAIVAGRADDLPALTPSAGRIAEGGMEHVTLAALTNPRATLLALKQRGYALVATASRADTPLFSAKIPPKTVVIMGGEIEGVSPHLAALADVAVAIPGTGVIDSLNVAVATGIILGDFWRRHRTT
jgi:TrmH RNA methyltransferase